MDGPVDGYKEARMDVQKGRRIYRTTDGYTEGRTDWTDFTGPLQQNRESKNLTLRISTQLKTMIIIIKI